MATQSPPETIPAIKSYSDIQSLELAIREQEIAWILRECFEVDRESRRIQAFIREQLKYDDSTGRFSREGVVVTKPVTLSDIISWTPNLSAQLAAVLYGPVAELVDNCLGVHDEWRFGDWPRPKQATTLLGLFAAAGIADRFAP
jgi:hypothetical protein